MLRLYKVPVIYKSINRCTIRGIYFSTNKPKVKETSEDWEAKNQILLNTTASLQSDNNKSKSTDSRTKRKGSPTNLYSKGNKHHDSQKQKTNYKNKARRLVIRWTTGSERAQEAANAIVQRLLKINHRGTVKFLNKETKQLEVGNLRGFLKGIDLKEKGISIVNIEKEQNQSIPVVKLVESKVALKAFSDELAKQKAIEMSTLGLMSKKYLTSQEGEKKEANTLKQIKISWHITDDDLCKQKAHEITNLLKKGFKVNIYLDDKKNCESTNWLEFFEDIEKNTSKAKISNKESVIRKNVFETLLEIVGEYSVKPTMEGNLETRMLLKLSPKPSLKDTTDIRKLA